MIEELRYGRLPWFSPKTMAVVERVETLRAVLGGPVADRVMKTNPAQLYRFPIADR